MRILILLSIIIFSCNPKEGNDKENKLIKIILDLNNPIEKVKFDNWVSNNIMDIPNDTIAKKYQFKIGKKIKEKNSDLGIFQFEDIDFEIYSICGGEWGGFLFFVDKKDRNIVHYLSSTCPLMVDFRDNNYFITESLAHMSGFTKISKIKNPRELPKVIKNKKLEEQSSFSNNVKETILDTVGIIANVFYSNHGRDYLIYSEYDTTYLGEVHNKRIISKEKLLNIGTWSNGYKSNKIKNGIYISNIEHSIGTFDMDGKIEITKEMKGKIYIKQDTIVIGYQYNISRRNTTSVF
jgi:hypothetical protein